eukprot:6866967-Alexandrium_andersonii.AAC.1
MVEAAGIRDSARESEASMSPGTKRPRTSGGRASPVNSRATWRTSPIAPRRCASAPSSRLRRAPSAGRRGGLRPNTQTRPSAG